MGCRGFSNIWVFHVNTLCTLSFLSFVLNRTTRLWPSEAEHIAFLSFFWSGVEGLYDRSCCALKGRDLQRLLRETSICDKSPRAARWRLVCSLSSYLLDRARKLSEARFRCGLSARPPLATRERVLPCGGLAATIRSNRLEAGVVTYTTTHILFFYTICFPTTSRLTN